MLRYVTLCLMGISVRTRALQHYMGSFCSLGFAFFRYVFKMGDFYVNLEKDCWRDAPLKGHRMSWCAAYSEKPNSRPWRTGMMGNKSLIELFEGRAMRQ